MYADDTQNYKHCSIKALDRGTASLQHCFGVLSEWMRSNKLKLNSDKTELIICASSHKRKQCDVAAVKLGDCEVSVSDTVRNLGVHFDATMSMDAQVNKLVSSCFYQLRRLKTIRRSLDRGSAETLVHAFITSRLDYCNSVYAGCSKKLLDKLQVVQNAAARLVTGHRLRNHITPALKELHWLKVPERITFKLCLLVYKCLHSQAPQYLCDRLAPVSSDSGRSHLRSAAKGDLTVPRMLSATYGGKPFQVAGPRAWNCLPQQLRDPSMSADTFKQKL
jgi:hypothetical protein